MLSLVLWGNVHGDVVVYLHVDVDVDVDVENGLRYRSYILSYLCIEESWDRAQSLYVVRICL